MIVIVAASVFAGTAGGLAAALALAVWATGPAVEGETATDRISHARDVVAECRRERALHGKYDPYRGIAYRADDPRRRGTAA